MILGYYFPPQGSAGSLRNFALAIHGLSSFESVCVGTAAFPHVQDHSVHLPEGISVMGIPHLDYHRLFQGSLARTYRRYFWPGRLRRILSACLPGLGYSEGGFWYIWRGYQLADYRIRQGGPWCMYSSYRPMADHWIAYFLKRRHPEVHWIADFRDLPHGVNRRLLRYLLGRADVVTTVSVGLAKDLQAIHPRVVVLPNAFCPLDNERMLPVRREYFELVYTGSLYPQQRLYPLPEALADLVAAGLLDANRVRIIYAGKDGGVWDRWWKDFPYRDMLTNKGLLRLREARELQAGAGINLLLSWRDRRDRGILTSKLYEYLYAGQPVLGIVGGDPEPELEDIFAKLQRGYLAYTHEGHLRGIRYFILQHYRAWLRGEAPAGPDLRWSWSENKYILDQIINCAAHEKGTLAE